MLFGICKESSSTNIILEGESLPIRQTNGSAGFDISANNRHHIDAWSRKLVSTGLKVSFIPDDYYLRIAPRSGLSINGIDIGAGVIDSDYRGEIKILVINSSSIPLFIDNKQRIAQLIPTFIGKINIFNTKDNNIISKINTKRGSDGFGSTGK